jgi:hypothetical protein
MFTLEQVVPWGRSFDEYRTMLALTDDDLGGRIIGCGDGPASFNAEATVRGHRVVSCDPIYRFDTSQIQHRIEATRDEMLAQVRLNAHDFIWAANIRSIEELGLVRMAAMRTFLDDFDSGKREGRYVDAELPTLPFESGAFDVALCSHLLFLYTTQLGLEFHRAALLEMCRVAAEVRVFPLLTLGGDRSEFVAACVDDLEMAGQQVTVELVPYEFRRGGNEMMRIRRPRRAQNQARSALSA